MWKIYQATIHKQKAITEWNKTKGWVLGLN